MSTEILNALIGLVVGLVTGFYFDRRATKQANAQHEESLEENKMLRERINELEALLLTHRTEIQDSVRHVQESVYTSARTDSPRKTPATGSPEPAALLTDIRAWVDVNGLASVSEVKRRFVEKGYSPGAFEALLEDLAQSGEIRVVGKKVELI